MALEPRDRLDMSSRSREMTHNSFARSASWDRDPPGLGEVSRRGPRAAGLGKAIRAEGRQYRRGMAAVGRIRSRSRHTAAGVTWRMNAGKVMNLDVVPEAKRSKLQRLARGEYVGARRL